MHLTSVLYERSESRTALTRLFLPHVCQGHFSIIRLLMNRYIVLQGFPIILAFKPYMCSLSFASTIHVSSTQYKHDYAEDSVIEAVPIDYGPGRDHTRNFLK